MQVEREANFNEFSKRMIYLKGVLDQSTGVLRQTQKAWKNDMQKEKRLVNISNFFFKDIQTGQDRDLNGNFSIGSDGVLNSLSSLNNRFNSYGLIHGFEAFKRFLRNDLALMIFDNDLIYQQLHLKCKDGNALIICSQSLESIKKGLDFKYRKAKDLLVLYKKVCKASQVTINTIYSKNYFGISILELTTKAEGLRHDIVHNNNEIADQSIKSSVVNFYFELFVSTAHYLRNQAA